MGGLNMKLIKPSFEIWEQELGLEGIYKAIERAGRICYKSSDKITEDSAKLFVDRMIQANHLTPLEHGAVYLKVPNNVVDKGFQLGTNWSTLCLNPYTKYSSNGDYYYYTTNYRVIIEHDLQGVLDYICEPTEFHQKRVTVHFTLDRSTANEFVRHRVFSFMQESQRYCAYNRDKFGGEVTFIKPCWIKDDIPSISVDRAYEILYNRSYLDKPISPEYKFYYGLAIAEDIYLNLLKDGWKPQEARAVLPNACKTELVMTGTIEQWKEFFELRIALNAHPSARELAIPLKEEFIKREYIND